MKSYLLPGLTAGIFARSGGNLSASNASTCNEIKLSNGTPKFTAPLERSTTIATPTTLSAVRADDVQRFLHAPAFGHDILDDENFFARRNLESAPQNQFAFLFFHKNKSQAQLPRDFLADDQSAHRRRNHRDRAERF